MTEGLPHVPVLLDEVLAALAPIPDAAIVDGTFGAGGYSRALLQAGAARVVGIDRDPTAVPRAEALGAEHPGRFVFSAGTFSDLDAHAAAAGLAAVDGVVLDIGVSSMQLDEAERGFSFRADGPLDMRMSLDGPSAADFLNAADWREIARVLSVYGEERQAGRIARAIVARRDGRPLARTSDLVAAIESVLGGKRFGEVHPATRSFQAIRIHVNRELDELADALAAAERVLAPGGRLAVVSFHSLEDRIVKRFLADRARTTAQGSRHLPETAVPPATFRIPGRQPVEAGETEATVTLRISGDRTRESHESFSVVLSDPSSGLDIGTGAAAATILNDDGYVIRGTSKANSLKGSGLGDKISGLGGDDRIYAKSGDDYIDGGSGRDRMYGGGGDDIYVVDNRYDRAYENSSAGTDTVYSKLTTYKLGANIENLKYTGSSTKSFTGTGNSLDNTIQGRSGNDYLDGGAGSDTLWGGAGRDSFIFRSALGPNNIDTIKDFNTADDTVRLENGVFSGLGSQTGRLSADMFAVGTAAGDANDRILFDDQTGALYYDPDGSGAAAAVQFAVLDLNRLSGTLSASDFLVI